MDSAQAFELADLNAVICDLFDRGRAQAAELDASGRARDHESGPLAGVPFLLKDLGASLAGTPEAMGSRALRAHVATETAWIVDRYLLAGLGGFRQDEYPRRRGGSGLIGHVDRSAG